MSNVIPFRSREAAMLERKTREAWTVLQRAIRESTAAQARMHTAHSKWIDLDLKLYAANAAEKINHG